MFPSPITQLFGNVTVVRDDLIPGGTKARFVDSLFDDVDEVVYATPAQGGAQTALALSARKLNKKLTLFVAAHTHPHERLALSKNLGAEIVQVSPGWLNNIQARARQYANGASFLQRRRVRNLEFGFGTSEFINCIAETARQIPHPEQLWCSAGSGTLAKGLAKAWPGVPLFVVQIGHKLKPNEIPGATIIVYPKKYGYAEPDEPPFPSDPHYERKAWKAMLERIGNNKATFWNVAGAASDVDTTGVNPSKKA